MKAYKKAYILFFGNIVFFIFLIAVSLLWYCYTDKLFILTGDIDILNFIILVRIVFFTALILLGFQYVYRWHGENRLSKAIQRTAVEHSRNHFYFIEGVLLILFGFSMIGLQVKNLLIYL